MAQTLADKSVGGSLKTASYRDVCDHINDTGKTEEHELYWLPQWPGMLLTEDHAQLAG